MTTDAIGQAYRDLRWVELMLSGTMNTEMRARFRRIRSVLAWAMAALEVVNRVSTDAKPGEPISEQLIGYVSKLLAE